MTLRSSRGALRVCVALAFLAGCGGGSSPVAPGNLSVAPLVVRTTPNGLAAAERPDRSRSWMNPKAKSMKALLYISDAATDDVYVYDYPSGTAVGKLTGFEYPDGQCVDAQGDVYITNFKAESVVEYARGGTYPIKALATDGHAIGCSVSPSGDLAVTNFYTKKGAGNVQIFKNASGTPADYSDPATCYYMWPAGYDGNGNLFVEGEYATVGLCWLPAGGSTMSAASFNQPIIFPGSVMWDGKFITLTDQEYQAVFQTGIYQTVLSGSNGALSEVGVTALNDRCRQYYTDVAQPFVIGKENTPVNDAQGTAVAGSNLWCTKRFDLWAYPTGKYESSLKSAPAEPTGESVSIAGSSFASSRADAAKKAKACGWLSHSARNGQPLAYVADANEVLVFPESGEDPNAAPIGCIDDGIYEPYGLYVDGRRNLYVVNRAEGTVTVYKPGSVKMAATYLEDLSQPLYAVVDAQGDLWVSNSGGGTVVEYGAGTIVVKQVLQTAGSEADGLDFDAQGNLYVAFRTNYSGGIEKFAPGSTQGQVLGMQLQQPQGLIVASSGDILVVETGKANRIDLFRPGKSTPKLEIGVPQGQTLTQLAITEKENQLFVSSSSPSAGIVYVTDYPLHDDSVFRMNLDLPGGNVQGMAISNGQHF